MEGDYKALESAYLKTITKPGERILVNVEGLLARRPSMEESQPPLATLVVERFVGVYPGRRCRGPLTASKRKSVATSS